MTKKNLYIETYGCQMNFSDSEIVASVLKDEYIVIDQPKDADLILINTCSIRDNAEQRVLKRLSELNTLKKKNRQRCIGIYIHYAGAFQIVTFLSRLFQRFWQEKFYESDARKTFLYIY